MLVTGIAWVILSIFAALPFVLTGDAGFVDAYFETVSGFTMLEMILLKIFGLSAQSGFPETVRITCLYSDETSTYTVATGSAAIHQKDRLFLCATRTDIRKAAAVIQKT